MDAVTTAPRLALKSKLERAIKQIEKAEAAARPIANEHRNCQCSSEACDVLYYISQALAHLKGIDL